MALRYVGRFATSRAQLRSYLERKVRERGWDGDAPPAYDALAARFCELGYVDDAAYALSKSQSLVSRGYGRRRLEQKLRLDGIADDDATAARALASSEAVEAALRFAKRRRIGPFGIGASDPRDREKALSAMVRAGHSFSLARAIVQFEPGAEVDPEVLRDRAGIVDD
jgi:regulatory protein